MKKSILNLGKALNKAEQKQVFGGYIKDPCSSGRNMDNGCMCNYGSQCSSDTCAGVYRGLGWCK